MPFEKNDSRINRNGRPQGSQNKVSNEIKELITEFISGNFEQIEKDIMELETRDRVKFYIDLLPYVLPKPKETENTTETEPIQVIVSERGKELIDQINEMD